MIAIKSSKKFLVSNLSIGGISLSISGTSPWIIVTIHNLRVNLTLNQSFTSIPKESSRANSHPPKSRFLLIFISRFLDIFSIKFVNIDCEIRSEKTLLKYSHDSITFSLTRTISNPNGTPTLISQFLLSSFSVSVQGFMNEDDTFPKQLISTVADSSIIFSFYPSEKALFDNLQVISSIQGVSIALDLVSLLLNENIFSQNKATESTTRLSNSSSTPLLGSHMQLPTYQSTSSSSQANLNISQSFLAITAKFQQIFGLVPQIRFTLLNTLITFDPSNIFTETEQASLPSFQLNLGKISLSMNIDAQGMIDNVNFTPQVYNSNLKVASSLTINDTELSLKTSSLISEDSGNIWKILSIPSILFTLRAEITVPHPSSIAPKLGINIFGDAQISNPTFSIAAQLVTKFQKIFSLFKSKKYEQKEDPKSSKNFDSYMQLIALNESSINLSLAIADPRIFISILSYLPETDAVLFVSTTFLTASLKTLSNDSFSTLQLPSPVFDMSVKEICVIISNLASAPHPLQLDNYFKNLSDCKPLIHIDSMHFSGSARIIPPSAFAGNENIDTSITVGFTIDSTLDLSIQTIFVDLALLTSPSTQCPNIPILISKISTFSLEFKNQSSSMSNINPESSSPVVQRTFSANLSVKRFCARASESNRRGGLMFEFKDIILSVVLSKTPFNPKIAWNAQLQIPKSTIFVHHKSFPPRNQPNSTGIAILSVVDTVFTRDPEVVVTVNSIFTEFELSHYFVIAASLFPLADLKPDFKSNALQTDSIQMQLPIIQLVIHKVVINCVFPQKVNLTLHLNSIFGTTKNAGGTMKVSKIVVEVPVSITPPSISLSLVHLEGNTESTTTIQRNLLEIQNTTASFQKEKITFSIGVIMESVAVVIPYAFELALVIENAVNVVKAMKVINKSMMKKSYTENLAENGNVLDLGVVEPDYNGETYIDHKMIPQIDIEAKQFSLKMDESPFEVALNRSFRWGIEEQKNRLQRDLAFQKKSKELKMKRSKLPLDEGYYSVDDNTLMDLENFWWSLQEYHSDCWLNLIRKKRGGSLSTRNEPPSILNAMIRNLRIVISSPELPCETVENSLHFLDHQTAPKLIYDQLIPRNVIIQFKELLLLLKDYREPFLHIPPASGSDKNVSWSTEGLIVLAEKLAGEESQRKIIIPLGSDANDWLPTICVTRTMNPPKIYSSTNTTISPGILIRFTWGAALEGAVADMVRVIETFTMPSMDPSAPIGWWDKLRLMIHGRNTAKVLDNGEMRVRILGSLSPYYENTQQFSGSEGIEFIVSSGVHLDVGEIIAIECGTMCLVAPNDVPGGSERLLLRFSGGVRIVLGFRLEVSGYEDGCGLTHADVILKSPEYAVIDGKLKDSYEGFRSSSIHIDIDVNSPGQNLTVSTSSPMNYLVVTPDSLDRVRKIFGLIQSPVTGMITRRGKLFQPQGIQSARNSRVSLMPSKSSSSFSISGAARKPKLSRMIGSLRLKVSMYPLLLGFLHEIENQDMNITLTSGLGVRLRAEKMIVDLFLKQRSVQDMIVELGFTDFTTTDHHSLASEIHIPRSTRRWRLIETRIDVSDSELRTVTFGDAGVFHSDENEEINGRRPRSSEDDENEDEENEDNENIVSKEWIIEEDYLYVNNPGTELKMNSFLWAPRGIYFKRKGGDTWDEDLKRSDT
ncbi:hypothetical protein HK096_007815, partial [Nowakowskiella sp. JEL0078]